MDADSSRAANEAEEVRKNVTTSTLINKRKPEDQERKPYLYLSVQHTCDVYMAKELKS